MTQEERLDLLVTYLLNEIPGAKKGFDQKYVQGKANLFRSLVNIRPAKRASEAFLALQDEYLKEEIAKKGIVTLEGTRKINDRIFLYKGDIVQLKVDAIVNAANSQMLGCFIPCHRCIDNAIHTYAGVQLRLECRNLMTIAGYEEEPTGSAQISKAYNLPSKHVIHTVGPIVQAELTQEHCKALKSCYESCLKLAAEREFDTIAFCCISTGEYHFPNDKACEIAIETVQNFMKTNDKLKVVFNVFKQKDYELYFDKLTKN